MYNKPFREKIYSDVELFKDVINNSKSWSEVCKKLNLIKSSSRLKKMQIFAQELNINYDHFIKKVKLKEIRKICPICKITFITKKSRKEKTTCSHSCANTYFKTDYENPNYYRRKALDFYINECVICKENRLHILEVHHINKNRLDNDIFNLKILCKNCHADLHFNDRIQGSSPCRTTNKLV